MTRGFERRQQTTGQVDRSHKRHSYPADSPLKLAQATEGRRDGPREHKSRFDAAEPRLKPELQERHCPAAVRAASRRGMGTGFSSVWVTARAGPVIAVVSFGDFEDVQCLQVVVRQQPSEWCHCLSFTQEPTWQTRLRS